MSMDRLHLRFNRKNATDRNVVAYLENMDVHHQSRNRQVIEMLAECIDHREHPLVEDLADRVRQIFREELDSIPVAVAPVSAGMPSLELTEEEEARNAASVLADLEMFG